MSDSVKRYYFVSAIRRVWCRIIDMAIAIALAIMINLIIILSINKSLTIIYNWELLLYVLITTGIFFCYFIVLPIFIPFQTIGLLLTKTMVLSFNNKKNKFIALFNFFRKELFVWIFWFILFIAIGISLNYIERDKWKKFFDEILTSFSFDKKYEFGYYAAVFFSFYVVLSLVSFILFINLFYHNKRKCIIDIFSYTIVVYKDDDFASGNKNKQEPKKQQFKHQHILSSEEFEEIKKL